MDKASDYESGDSARFESWWGRLSFSSVNKKKILAVITIEDVLKRKLL